nr:hypothetical protein [Treponemataceae bacterium]
HAGRFNYLTSRWGSTYESTTRTGGNYGNYRNIRMESIGVYDSNKASAYYNEGYGVIMEDRFPSSSIVATSKGRTGTTVYVAYYDDLKQQIRFRYGTNTTTSKTEFDQFLDQRDSSYKQISSNSIFESYAGGWSIIADTTTAKDVVKSGNYVSIAVIPGTSAATDVVVATWYDATNSAWWYSYKEKPNTDNDYDLTQTDYVSGYWSVPMKIMDEAGEHCKITVAFDGSIHMASYAISNADLMYAYLPSYDAESSTLETCVVDSYSITGTYISIDTGVSASGNVIPYISYYMQSTLKAKTAYLVEPTDEDGNIVAITDHAPDGSDGDEAFTGAWEISIIPTSSRVIEDNVNVGLWKNKTTGKLVKSTTGTSSTNEGEGIVYGNGSANPVYGYAIKEGTVGFIEIAQKR